ncbi:MAG: hypothetical protein LC649_04445 [Bacteroidales bacterium]|nr:hypothetical protein [Bacteroidales bacterium]
MKKSYKLTVVLLLLIAIMAGSTITASAQRRRSGSDQETEKYSPESSMFSALKFRLLGPASYSGRIADFAVNPDNPSEYYVGVAAGGLWKTENKGTTFDPIFDSQPVFSIGALAIDHHNPNVLWVGTGENNTQRNLAYGDGVYKTTDGGRTFKNMGLKKSEHIGKIMIDPRNSNVVYVAAQGPAWGPGGDRGLYKTTDGGVTWDQILYIGEYTGITDMEIDPGNPDIIYAAAHQRERRVYSKINGGPESALYKSEDAGKSWKKLTTGFPGGDVGRIGIALSPANPDIVYAIVELPEGKGGFYRSLNLGESWSRMSDMVAGSPQYYNEIYADPVDPDRVISMDVRNMVTDDGGATWRVLGEKNKHVDNHALWIDPDNTNYYLMGCDGGIYESWDRGANWVFKSNFPVTQYYHVRVDNDLPFYNVYGGTQDNGSWFGPSRTLRRNLVNADWTYTIGGDGYLSIPDPDVPDIHYAESQYCGLRRYDRRTGNSVSIKPQPVEDEIYRFNWNTPYFISPHNSKTLYVAANKVLKSTDRGDSWTEISPDLTRQISMDALPMMGKIWPPEAVAKNLSTSPFGNIFALAESPLSQGMIYAGTDDGLIWITEDDGGNWTKYSSFPGVPDMTFVNYVLPSMHDKGTVYACFDGRKNSSDFTPYLIASSDNGKTWRSIASNLPEGTVYAIQEDHLNPDILFIGTEWGVWVTLNGGEKWTQLKNGLPTIQVKDLTIQRRENDLVVATFGRGFYVLEDYSYLRQLSNETEASPATIFDIKDGLLYYPATNQNYQGEVHFSVPNPTPAVTIRYWVKDGYTTLLQKRQQAQKEAEKAGREIDFPTREELIAEAEEESALLLFTLSDEGGNIMRKIETPLRRGVGSISWDMSYLDRRGPAVPPGIYSVKMEKYVNGKFETLAENKEFRVNTLNNNALGTPDYRAKFEFMKKAIDLSEVISETARYASDLKQKIGTIKSDLMATPAVTHELLLMAKETEKSIDEFIAVVSGIRSSARVDAEVPTIASRARFAVSAVSSAEDNIMGSQIEQYEIAREKFSAEYDKLKEIVENDFPGLKQELRNVGILWTPGEFPEFR